MISIDRGLLGKGQLGDVLERHAEYGKHVDRLDIIVFSAPGFSENKISQNVSSFPTNSKSKIRYFFDAKKLGVRLFNQNKYDLIVTQDPFVTGLVGVKLKKLFGAKLLVHFHGDFWQNPSWLRESRLNWFFWLISKWVVSKADGIRVMSEGQKDKLVKAEVAEEKIRIISTPINFEKIEKACRSQVADKGFKIILQVGRDDEVKDYKTLIKAYKLVKAEKSLRTVLYQAGADKQIEIAMKNEGMNMNKDDITLFSLAGHKDVLYLYPQADVVVLSSRSESFGKVLVEANACGKPVVSTATTGAKEIIQDGYNGFLVPIGAAAALAEKMVYLLENPAKAKAMGENGRRLVKEKYGNNLEKIIQFWQKIINSNL